MAGTGSSVVPSTSTLGGGWENSAPLTALVSLCLRLQARPDGDVPGCGLDRAGIAVADFGDGLEVRDQLGNQPHQLDID